METSISTTITVSLTNEKKCTQKECLKILAEIFGTEYRETSQDFISFDPPNLFSLQNNDGLQRYAIQKNFANSPAYFFVFLKENDIRSDEHSFKVFITSPNGSLNSENCAIKFIEFVNSKKTRKRARSQSCILTASTSFHDYPIIDKNGKVSLESPIPLTYKDGKFDDPHRKIKLYLIIISFCISLFGFLFIAFAHFFNFPNEESINGFLNLSEILTSAVFSVFLTLLIEMITISKTTNPVINVDIETIKDSFVKQSEAESKLTSQNNSEHYSRSENPGILDYESSLYFSKSNSSSQKR